MSDIIFPERSNRDGNKNSPSKMDKLRNHIENVMKGFHGSNAIAYKNKNEYVTYSRPADCLRASTSTDEFEPDNKNIWPVLNNMGASLPDRLVRRPHRVDDPDWTVPVSSKTPIQVFPQSKGLKLRQVDEIINDKQLFNQFIPPSSSQEPSTTFRLSNSNTPKTFEPPLSTVQGVLDIITETSRKPNRPAAAVKKRSLAVSTTTGTNRPRKSSLLKSEITSTSQKPTPTQVGSKKPMSLLNNHPRVSSKSTSVQKIKYNQDIPDLIEARNYLLEETDEVEYKKLDHLIEAQPNTRMMPRPKLFLHFKKSLPALQKAAEKQIPSGKATEHEPTVNKKLGLPENPITTSPLKNKYVDIPTNTSSSSTPTTTPSSVPIAVTPPPPLAITKKSLSDQPKTTQEKSTVQEKPAYASSIPAAFLRKMKIPKRKASEIELEEGETISPSPSPLHSDTQTPPPPPPPLPSSTKVKPDPKRSRHENVEVEEVVSPSTTITQEPVVSSSSSSNRKYSSRREEERSSSRRRDRYSDDVRRASTSSKRSHYRSRSRSRSPKRSESSRRRQTSSESSRRTEKRKSVESSSKYDEPITKRQRVDKESSSGNSRDRDRLVEKERLAEKDRLAEKERLIAEKEKLIAEKEKAALERERLAAEKEKAAEKERVAAEKERVAMEKERAAVEKERLEKEKQAEKSRGVSSASSSFSSTTTTATAIAEKESNSSSGSNNKKASTSTTTTTSTEKALSATAANAETPEQFKVFLFMFSKLAHANKKRGDKQTNPTFAMIDHFHAFCDYILNFYYVDRLNPTASFKQASVAWKSIFPFTDSLLKKLESQKELELYGLCIRLNSLIRFYMYSRMESSTRPVLLQQMSNTNSEKMTDRACVELSENLLHEYEKAERAYKESERFMSYSTLVTQYPTTFRNVCMEGNLLAGITLGGEAGVSVSPMFPFAPYSPLHHAAIVAKCILAEYVSKNNLKYTPISKFDEFM